MAVIRKVNKLLRERFRPPDKVNLRDENGIIGVVTSTRFRRMDTMQRQDMIHEILENGLTDEERRQVLIVVAVTPEEEAADSQDVQHQPRPVRPRP
jgi:acid stress-induced BolA-like protein IbaG/YrbA